MGHFNPEVFSRIAQGEELALPNFGAETVHHVHAEDVAQVVLRAILDRSAAVGEAFNAVSAQALNLRGYAEAMFRWFGHEPRLRFQPFEEWKAEEAEEDARLLTFLQENGVRPGHVFAVVDVADHIGTLTLRRVAAGADDGHEVVLGLSAAAKLRMLRGRADPALFHRVPERARLAVREADDRRLDTLHRYFDQVTPPKALPDNR